MKTKIINANDYTAAEIEEMIWEFFKTCDRFEEYGRQWFFGDTVVRIVKA